MKYLKNYKLYESVADIFKKLPIEESDISDILLDLKDVGFNIDYKSFFLSNTGKTYDDSRGIGDYYPVILISITRKKKDVKDVRNWDGSLYFEDSESVLESIYHSISRLKNTLNDYKVYFNIRNINEIYIRIVFDKVVQDEFNLETAMAEYKKLINEYYNIDAYNNRYDETDYKTFYGFEEGLTSRSTTSFEIKPIKGRDTQIDIVNPDNILSHIIKRSKIYIENNNKSDLNNIFKLFLEEYTKRLNFKNLVKIKEGSTTFRIVNSITKDTYITIDLFHEPYGTYKYLKKKGIFKNTYGEYNLYKLDVDARFKIIPKS